MVLPVDQFYKSPKGGKTAFQQRVESRVKQQRENPLLNPHHYSLHDDSRVWKVFPLQNDAYTYLKSCYNADKLKIFSFESESSNGGRRYLVTSADHFWSIYQSLKPQFRHCYELIREGHPCRLYFDLEFDRQMNPDMMDEQCVERFVELVKRSLKHLMGVDCPEGCVLDLNSSTQAKFSRHLIFHLPNNALFSNNVDAGCFVKEMCLLLRNMTDDQRREDGMDCLFVLSKDGRPTLICDEGVYTRNRTFRLFLSTKLKQSNPFHLAASCNFYKQHRMTQNDRQIFLDSLVEVNDGQVVSYSTPIQSSFKSPWPVSSLRHHDYEDVVDSHDGPLPYPALNDFFVHFLKAQKSGASVRRWSRLKCSNLLVLDISKYRYCHRIGREHKSNHIMYIVDLKRKVFFQKCHDAECRSVDYRSNDFLIPSEVFDDIEQ